MKSVKRARMEEEGGGGGEESNDVPTLMTLAAASMTGPEGFFAQRWAEDNDPRAFDMMQMYREIEANTNVTGRIPRPAPDACSYPRCQRFQIRPPEHMEWCPAFYDMQNRESLHGKDLEMDRRTGRFRGHARVQGRDWSGDGVVVRVDSVVFPTAWLEIKLSAEQVREMHAMLE
jgi:hypothetical protein